MPNSQLHLHHCCLHVNLSFLSQNSCSTVYNTQLFLNKPKFIELGLEIALLLVIRRMVDCSVLLCNDFEVLCFLAEQCGGAQDLLCLYISVPGVVVSALSLYS